MTAATALIGHSDWLFLNNDTNGSVKLFTGEILMPEQRLSGWHQYFDDLAAVSALHGADTVFMIAPSKESVYTKFYPFQRGTITLDGQFRDAFPAALDLRACLLSTEMVTYDKTDTHWNDWGAFVAYREALRAVRREITAFAPEDFHIEKRAGDLGQKLDPVVTGNSAVFDQDALAFRVFDNGIHNHGRIWQFRNDAAPIRETCLSIGDSFGLYGTPFLARTFTDVTFIHTMALDRYLIELVNPDVILAEATERFLIRPPEPMTKFSLADTVAEKIRSMSPNTHDDMISRQRPIWPEFHL